MIYDILDVSEAAKCWGKSPSTLRRVFDIGASFQKGVDCRKGTKGWLVTVDAMRRVYGEPVESLPGREN